jgi:pimeloyl-ACP methyl ester carboxylesterase
VPKVPSQGVPIHYEVVGDGPPLVLIHGLSVSVDVNWKHTGWIDHLSPSHQLTLVDLRGHGLSGKPHKAKDYSLGLMAEDVLTVLDTEGVERTAIMGYSMGAMVTMELLLNHPGRFTAAVLGGMGTTFPKRGEWRTNCKEEETEPPPRQESLGRGRGTRSVMSFFRHYDPIAQRRAQGRLQGQAAGRPGAAGGDQIADPDRRRHA